MDVVLSERWVTLPMEEYQPEIYSGEGFTGLFHQFQKPIYGFLLRLSGDPELASDLAQDTFLRAFAALPGMEGPVSIRPYLFRIARNLYIDHLRRRREVVVADPGQLKPATQLDSSTQAGMETFLDRKRVSGTVRRALARMRPRDRMCLLLRDVQGLSYAEAAETVGMTVPAFNSALARARARFRRHFTRELFPEIAPHLEGVPMLADLFRLFDPADPPPDLASAVLGRVTAYFDSMARDWDRTRSEYFGDSVREEAINEAGPQPGGVVADFGGGTGYLAKGLAQLFQEVVLVDISDEMIHQARVNLGAKGLTNVRYVRGDVCSLPLPTGSLDMGFGCMVLHHVLSPPRAIEEMVRVLKPGGQLVLVDLERHHHTWFQREMKDVWLGFDPQDLKGWLQRAGLSRVRIRKTADPCCTGGGTRGGTVVPILIASGSKSNKRNFSS